MNKKIGLFYGSDWGHTERIAKLIQSEFKEAEVDLFDVGKTGLDHLDQYSFLILGVPTAEGHNLQKSWRDVYLKFDQINLKGKVVALFGLGDQKTFPEYFCDALGLLYQKVKTTGAKIIGSWPIAGYHFEESYAQVDGSFVGLVLDIENQPHQTHKRIVDWVALIKREFKD